MQEDREKFTFRTKRLSPFCGICIRTGSACILLYEVRKYERRGKAASALGSNRPQASGDPIRSYGKPDQKPNAVKDRLAVSSVTKKQDRLSDPVSYLFSFSY